MDGKGAMEMRVLFSPQMNEKEKIEYQFDGEKITVTLNGETDAFDFTGMPDGRADSLNFTTTLPYCPVVEAVRENGVLSVKLLFFVTRNSPQEELFPEWVTV